MMDLVNLFIKAVFVENLALTFFLGMLVGIGEMAMKDIGGSGLSALIFDAVEAILKIAAALYFPFLAVRLVTKWRKVDWLSVSVKGFVLWTLLILVVYEAVTFALTWDRFQAAIQAKLSNGSLPAPTSAMMIGAIVGILVVDIAVPLLLLWFAARRAKNKAIKATVAAAPVQA